jgi:hypothetical protein
VAGHRRMKAHVRRLGARPETDDRDNSRGVEHIARATDDHRSAAAGRRRARHQQESAWARNGRLSSIR